MDQVTDSYNIRKEWWSNRRLHYTQGLIASFVTSMILFAVLDFWLIAPLDPGFEFGLFEITSMCVVSFVIILIANLFYNLGCFIDKHYNLDGTNVFRIRLYNVGYWFSVSIPFIFPTLVIIEYLQTMRSFG